MKLVILTIALVILSSLAWSASDWYESTIVFPSPFQGNHKEIFILSDGSVWEVVKGSLICTSFGSLKCTTSFNFAENLTAFWSVAEKSCQGTFRSLA